VDEDASARQFLSDGGGSIPIWQDWLLDGQIWLTEFKGDERPIAKTNTPEGLAIQSSEQPFKDWGYFV
jgi:hypothetical protein